MAARQVAIATSVRAARTHRHVRVQAAAHSRVAVGYQAHRARQRTRLRQALTIAQAHHRRAAAVVHHHRAVRRRTIAVAQVRQVQAQAIAQAHRHRAAAVAHHHRAVVQALRARLVHSAVAHRVVAAADSILQGVCLQVWHTPCRNTPKTLLIV